MKNKTAKTILGILLIASIIPIATSSGETVFSIDMEIEPESSVEIQEFETTGGEPSMESPDGMFEARVYDSDEEELYTHEFRTGAYIAPHGNATVDTLESINTTIRVPYLYEAEKIDILEEDEVKESIDIPEKICVDDGSCHFYCEGRGLDPDCETEEHQKASETTIIDRITSTLRALIRPLI